MDPAARIAALRAELTARNLDAFVVPRADEHQGEYVPASAERLLWISGFSGSAGTAIIARDHAALFVDGRYTIQARAQAPAGLFTVEDFGAEAMTAWLGRCAAGARLGYDPWLHTPAQVERLQRAVAACGGALVAATPNPLDAVWTDRPAPPQAPVVPHPIEYAGESAAAKRARMGAAVAAQGAAALALTAPDSICWLLNVRGGDTPRTPFVLSFAILHADGRVAWFVDEAKLNGDARAHLDPEVTVAPPSAFADALRALGGEGATVLVDPESAAQAIVAALEDAGARVARAADPCQRAKACKNAAELAGVRAAHVRDGAAVTRFLRWIAETAPTGGVDEAAAAARLEGFRRDTNRLLDLSFDTITAAGPHGALPHYRVTAESNRPLNPGDVYLVDSGGQYRDGTTDITRTMAIGALDPAIAAEARDRYTRVLKGHIAIAQARFPRGVTGAHLDVLARMALWRAGVDYDHGTGHGVGAYLSVHEGPQRISRTSDAPLEPGMVLSNEPGFYKEGAYGIRIENLVIVTEPTPVDGGDRAMMGFETITLAPIDASMIEAELLTPAEIAWLDRYHARVRETLSPLVDEETRAWLIQATAPLAQAARAA